VILSVLCFAKTTDIPQIHGVWVDEMKCLSCAKIFVEKCAKFHMYSKNIHNSKNLYIILAEKMWLSKEALKIEEKIIKNIKTRLRVSFVMVYHVFRHKFNTL